MKWRPRFSLRTLLVLVTLTCVYFAAWEVTKRKGVRDFRYHHFYESSKDFDSPLPFVVGVTESPYEEFSLVTPILGGKVKYPPLSKVNALPKSRVLHLWFFGWTWETPIRWEVAQPDPGAGFFHNDDVQYYAPGKKFKLLSEAESLKEYSATWPLNSDDRGNSP